MQPLLDFEKGERSKRGILSKSLAGLLFIGSISLGITYAASIDMNTGDPVEFGQGISVSVACDDEITLVPIAAFTNESGTYGEFRLSGIKVSNIDVISCDATNFTFRAFGSDQVNQTALPLTSSLSKLSLVSYDDQIWLADEQSGVTISETETVGNATLTFTSPVTNSNQVFKVTLESESLISSYGLADADSEYSLMWLNQSEPSGEPIRADSELIVSPGLMSNPRPVAYLIPELRNSANRTRSFNGSRVDGALTIVIAGPGLITVKDGPGSTESSFYRVLQAQQGNIVTIYSDGLAGTSTIRSFLGNRELQQGPKQIIFCSQANGYPDCDQ